MSAPEGEPSYSHYRGGSTSRLKTRSVLSHRSLLPVVPIPCLIRSVSVRPLRPFAEIGIISVVNGLLTAIADVGYSRPRRQSGPTEENLFSGGSYPLINSISGVTSVIP